MSRNVFRMARLSTQNITKFVRFRFRPPAAPEGKSGDMRLQVLVIRLILGVIFGVLLYRVFFPTSSFYLVFIFAGLLVIFAYGMEYLHKRDDR